MNNKTWSQRIADKGRYNDMREYQQLKTANEMERAGTNKLYEHLRRKHGETTAKQMMRQQGYDLSLLS
jgi:hypothetical protein